MARIVAAIALPTYYRGRIDDVEGWLEKFDDDGARALSGRGRHREAGSTRSAGARSRPSAGSPPPSAVRPTARSLRRAGDLAPARGALPRRRRPDVRRHRARARRPAPVQPLASHGVAAARLHAGAPRARRPRRRDPRRGRGFGRAAERDRHADRRDQRALAPRVRARRARRRPSSLASRARARRGGTARRLHDERARARRVRTHLPAQQPLGPGPRQPGLRAQPDATT